MIIDCFTHTWESPDQLGRCLPTGGVYPPAFKPSAQPPNAGASRHLLAAEPVDITIVLGFVSRYLDSEIANDTVAGYVGQHLDRMVGFAGVDPSHPREALAELNRARTELSMPGLAIAPAAQGFHPADSHAMLVYAEAADHHMPIIFHTGLYVTAQTKLEYASPVLLDEVARELPNLKIVIAHLGYPWVHEALMLLAKHPNVYAEVSWLTQQPSLAYQALLSAHQLGVMDKLLFGSGFPATVASRCIEALYSINQLVHETNLPTIPRESIRGIVERDALSIMGISSPRLRPALERTATHLEDDGEDS